MSKRKRNTRPEEQPIEEIPAEPTQPTEQEPIEEIPAEPTQSTEQEPVEVEDEPILPPPVAPPVQTLEGEYLGMRAMKVEAGVYYALPAWVNVDGYREGDLVRVTVELVRVEKPESDDTEAEGSGAEPAAESETDGQ